jgi:Family of unknown function (DUF6502)
MSHRSISTPADDPGLSTSSQRHELALAALEQILLPAARLMIDNGLQLPAVVEAIKRALVLEANRAPLAERPNATRVAVLTGVHRKDVKRLTDMLDQGVQAEPDRSASVGSQVVARWISDTRFLDAAGNPLRLVRTPRYATDDSPSFSELVGAVSKDVGARAVLESLLQLDVVREVTDTIIELRLRAFVPSQAARESMYYLAANVADHFATAVHNQTLPVTGSPMLEQSAFSDGLSLEQVTQLHDMARAWWEKALKQFLRDATEAAKAGTANTQPLYRVRFGAYFYQAAEPMGLAHSNEFKR